MSASFLWAPAAMEQRTTTNIKTFQRQKEEDGCDFGASLVYIIDQPGLHSELLKQEKGLAWWIKAIVTLRTGDPSSSQSPP